jgi:hypothetical protein
MRALLAFFLVLTAGLLATLPLSGYNYLSSRWPSAGTTMHIHLGDPWDSAFITAISRWNNSTVFKFSYINQFADPCANPNDYPRRNGVSFAAAACGDQFDSTTLAITRTWNSGTTTLQSGIVFNNRWAWGIYDGAWSNGTRDFRRVAVHELGHVLGLDHEDDVPAIMATLMTTGDTIVAPQADDINGTNSLYGGSGPGDNTGPSLTITSHSNGQTVTSSSINVSGTASDSGRGNNGIASVTVNGVQASGGTTTAGGTANWSRTVTLSQGSNTITVVARDASSNQNSTTQTVTVTYNPAASSGSSPTLSTYHTFPQYADGYMPDGRYLKSTLMISNPGASVLNCTFRLHGLSVDGQTAFTYGVAPAGWLIVPSSAAQPLRSGYGRLQCTGSVEAQLVYSFYNPDESKISEATVFSSPRASSLQILGDGREGARIGIAVANDSDQPINIFLNAYQNTGALVGSTEFSLAARSNRAAYLDEFFPVPPETYGQIIVSSSSAAASMIGLRFTGDVFTTIPATNRSAIAATTATYHVFPQFADGVLSDGSYFRTTLMIANPSSSVGANCTFRIFGLTIDGESEYAFTFLGSGWTITQMGSSQGLQSGYATLECSERVDAQLLYSFYAANGFKLSEATVFPSVSATTTQVLADGRENARLGLAIANDTSQRVDYVIHVYDENGTLLPGWPVIMPLDPKTNRAAFINDLMVVPPNHYGQVVVQAPNSTGSIIGLRFTGNAFTTIPETIR